MNQDFASRPKTRVLVVDDSAFMRTALSRMIGSDPEFEVVGTACCGSEALSRIEALDPDVVTLDVQMVGLNGVETLRYIMARSPRPVIMVSAVTEKDAEDTFEALASGAFDYVPKQLSSTSLDIHHIREDLIAKIRAAGASRRANARPAIGRRPPQASFLEPWDATDTSPAIVAIGSSTGGPRAIQEIVPRFPRDLAVPILIVQHMPAGFTAPFAQRLNNICSVIVKEAVDREPLQPGAVYIAPAGMHMTVDRHSDMGNVIRLDTKPGDSLHIPSIDVMMKSVAENYRNRAVGVILTGMGSDGAEGMKAIYRRGGLTIGQDEASCVVYSMPRACAELGVLNRILPLSDIPGQILQAVYYRKWA